MALLGLDTADPATFGDPVVRRADVQALLARIEIVADRRQRTTTARVEAVAAEGRLGDATADTGVPATDLAEQGRRLRRKYDALARPVLGAGRADALAERVSALGSLDDARELLGRGGVRVQPGRSADRPTRGTPRRAAARRRGSAPPG
jgi:hypothetical protein